MKLAFLLERLEPARVGGVALAAAAVALVDTVTAASRAPRVPLDAGVVLFAGTAWALLFAATLPFVLVRTTLFVAVRRKLPRAAFLWLGAFDWVCFGYLAILEQAPKVPSRELQLHAFYLMIPVAAVGYAAVAWLSSRRPSMLQATRFAAGLGALGVATLSHWDRYEDVRVACTGVVVVAVSSAWSDLVEARRSAGAGRFALGSVAAALLVLLSAQLLLPVSHTARLLLHSRSAHARSVLGPVLRRADRDKDGAAPFFGGVDCAPRDATRHPAASERPGNGLDDNCADGDGETSGVAVPVSAEPAGDGGSSGRPTALAPPTPGRDVLLLSFDSLRWDAVNELSEVRRALGPHVEFSRAVSPAAQTFFSLGAMIRGKPVRQLKTERSRVLWRERSPTLADVLTKQGYRAYTVLTNQRWASEYGVTGGFDVIWPMNHAARDLPNPGAVNERFVAAERALGVALTTARDTSGPVLCWLHLMESHYPFHRRERTGPTDRSGFEAALRAVDAEAARFITEFRAARQTEPLVVVFGDHGEEFGEHGGLNHGNTVYADQVRVVLLLSLPGLESRVEEAPVSIAAIPATVLQQLGVAVPSEMTEPSLLPLLHGRGPTPGVAVSEMPAPGRHMVAYTGRRWRLVGDPVHRTWELFDMDHDPLEQVNVASEQPEALAEMRALARGWNERH